MKYHLVYRRSNDSGANWGTESSGIREVGTDRRYGAGGLKDYDSAGWYRYVDPDEDVRDEYLQYLRPSIVLNEHGWPAVVWHADSSEGDGTDYAIYYSYATTGGDGNVNWVAPDVLNWDQPSLLSSAAVGVGESDGERQLLHIAYMRKLDATGAWDVYYDSNEDRDRYEYAYLPLITNAH
jgi:hypothetical protein